VEDTLESRGENECLQQALNDPSSKKLHFLSLNLDVLTIIIKPLNIEDKFNIRLTCSYFSNTIPNNMDDDIGYWKKLQLLHGINSFEEWKFIKEALFTFPLHLRKYLLLIVTKDLILIENGLQRANILHKLRQFSPNMWDDVLDCELAKADFLYGFLVNQIKIVIPYSFTGIVLCPDCHHFISYLLLSGLSIIKQESLIDDFFQLEQFTNGVIQTVYNFITYDA
jgi:hypothetical protein